jgi:hypothetical protein
MELTVSGVSISRSMVPATGSEPKKRGAFRVVTSALLKTVKVAQGLFLWAALFLI